MAEIYRFSNLELDTSRFQVRRGGETLPVQPQVFDVLHYLVKNHDRIVSKEELLDTIWSGRVVSDTTLSSRIKAVRRLIGDTGKKQALLKTVRNRGFRFVAPVEAELTGTREISSGRIGGNLETSATSIAVLPFETSGEQGDQAYLGEGIAADIIALLAGYHWMRVIARGSSFAEGIRRSTPQVIGSTLGVRYLLCGRIRGRGSRLRIDVELVECASAQHLWNHGAEIERTDLFAVQETIAEEIAAAIEPRLAQIERQRVRVKPPDDFDAWDCCHKAFSHLYRFTTEDLETAKTWFDKALTFDPDLARAHAGKAYASVQLAFYGAPSAREAELRSALESSQSAVALDPWDAFNRFALGRSLCLMLRFPEAQAELEAAIETNHSFAQAYYALAFCHTASERVADAIPFYAKAVRMSPQDPHIWSFHHMRGMAHFRLDEMNDAEFYVRAATRQPNATYWPFATLCALLGDLGRTDEAEAIADRLLRMKSGYNLEFARQDFFFIRAGEFVERFLKGLSNAGIPAAQT